MAAGARGGDDADGYGARYGAHPIARACGGWWWQCALVVGRAVRFLACGVFLEAQEGLICDFGKQKAPCRFRRGAFLC